jgi:hypothetical protein
MVQQESEAARLSAKNCVWFCERTVKSTTRKGRGGSSAKATKKRKKCQ